MLRFFLSIKTFLWITGISIGIFLIGSLYIPHNLAIYSGINEMPLMKWIVENNNYLNKLFWIYILIFLMTLMWLNILICSIDAIIKKTALKGLMRVLSPQILHISILLVLLGHGVSAVSGYKEDVSMEINGLYKVKGFTLKLDNIEFLKKPGQSSTNWKVHMRIDNNPYILEVGKPSFYNGVGFFAKSAYQRKMKAVIGLVYDPGAMWEVTGAILFIIGATGIFYIRLKEKVL